MKAVLLASVSVLLLTGLGPRDVEAGTVVAAEGSMGAAARSDVARLATPRALSAAKRAKLERLVERTHRGPGPTAKGRPPRAGTAPQADVSTSQSDPAPQADGTFRFLLETDLRAALPPDNTSYVGEPCLAQRGRDVLVTGNWYAAASHDGGVTFGFLDPFTAFPAVNGGFCCDQLAGQEPSRGLFVWTLLYADDGVSNTVRLAVAPDQSRFETNQWTYYDFNPQQIGFGSNRWFDNPRMAFGSNSLFLTANVFATHGGPWFGTAILRIPVDPLRTGSSFTFQYLISTDHFTFTPVSGAGTTMYWASHDLLEYATRIYRWTEGDSKIFFDDVPVDPYVPEDGYCPGPDGLDWCARSDDRPLVGWVANGVIGFMWNAAQDDAHPYPHVRVLRVDEGTRAVLDQPHIWSTTTAFAYPAVAPNSRGHLGGVINYGGGSRYPSLAAVVLDDYSLPLATNGWELYTLAGGNSGPAEAKWGDYLCAAAGQPDTTAWRGVGYVMRDGPARANVHPLFAWMGRERDLPACVDGTPCNDGNACTTTDTCQGGACVGSHPVVCPAPAVCRSAGVCSPQTGACDYAALADGTVCEDGSVCTRGDRCSGGACRAGTPITGGDVSGFVVTAPDSTGCGTRDRALVRRVTTARNKARRLLLKATRNTTHASALVARAQATLGQTSLALTRATGRSAGCRAGLGAWLDEALVRVRCL